MDVEIGELEWDAWNEPHIAEHGVLRADVDVVCRGQRRAGVMRGGRLRVVGRTRAGRVIVAILDSLGGGRYYCVTAFPATGRVRREYLASEQKDES